jgi:hypothetical protein
MNLIDFLRKIGVLRFGTKKYHYTSGRDMPPEALMDDVYDAEKDLVTKQDFKNLQAKFQKKSADEE